MTDRQPITPPPELAQTIWSEMRKAHHEDIPCSESWNRAIAKAYQAGADMELEACLHWVGDGRRENLSQVIGLRDARRPKLPSETDQALAALREAEASGHLYVNGRSDTIRRALERLKELEAQP